MSTDRSDEIAARPERPTPQLGFDGWHPPKARTGGHALHRLHDPGRTVRWHGLQQKMHMVVIRADLKQRALIALRDFEAYLFQDSIDVRGQDCAPIFCRTDGMVAQN